MLDSREPPRKMLELLNEYIADQGAENFEDPLKILQDLEKTEAKEMEMKHSEGHNPYR